jgi:hypothetical protein
MTYFADKRRWVCLFVCFGKNKSPLGSTLHRHIWRFHSLLVKKWGFFKRYEQAMKIITHV